MSSSLGKKVVVPTSKKRKRASSSVGPTTKICHPLLQFPRGPQEEIFQILRTQPLIEGPLHRLGCRRKVQLADAIQALLTTNPWELFFGIIEPAYLELTMKLCSTFHLQTVMTNYDNPNTVQFCLGGLVRQLSILEFDAALGLYTEKFKEENDVHSLNHHIHRSPSRCWDALGGERALASSTLTTPTSYGVCRTGTSSTLPISSPSRFSTRHSGIGRGSSPLAPM
ncbi:hypothetical protein GOBAR_AA24088 [Gossypium barbadense]|uniref:Uncharacterized protein n=1 Tax=Gossypium barbadense TaxID=3634 RepID=A0A2P5WZR4_GOSBA|nr:hypothetical protein GOBAR_AA24087 [Gossypium barbadense]PPR96580.1 hypothetical protein GOBAR_AA24088 [Gossypium barbadense]